MTEQPWFLYIIRCNNGSLYTGITTDLKRRFEEHQEQGPKTAKYLRGKGPLQLVYTEQYVDKIAASRREVVIKKMAKSEKEDLIKSK